MRGRRAHNLCGVGELPQSVRIREVGPRDGFQNEPEVIPTAEKVRLIGMLGAAGLSRIELTSFVRPDVIPQLSDAEQVLAEFGEAGIDVAALATRLQEEGKESFNKSWDELLKSIETQSGVTAG